MSVGGIFRCRSSAMADMLTSEQNAMRIFKYDFEMVKREDYMIVVTIIVTGGLFYNEDGTVQTERMLISQESWEDLMAHIHKIFISTSA